MNLPSECVWRWMRRLAPAGCGAGVLLVLTVSALSADQQSDKAAGNAEALFIVQIVLLLLARRCSASDSRR
jgi:hypothetical protein